MQWRHGDETYMNENERWLRRFHATQGNVRGNVRSCESCTWLEIVDTDKVTQALRLPQAFTAFPCCI